jgi:hypothetical protein
VVLSAAQQGIDDVKMLTTWRPAGRVDREHDRRAGGLVPRERSGRALQLQIFQRMTPGERLQAAARLYWSARALKQAALRGAHLDWSESELRRAVRDAFLFHHD